MTQSRWSRSESGSLLVSHEPGRRSLIKGASAGAAALLLGCGTTAPGTGVAPGPGPGGQGGSGQVPVPEGSGAMGTPSCVVRPQQTLGPFPNKVALNRSDIRSEPGGTVPKPGLPLRLVFRVGQMTGATCRAYPGVAVDLWQCDVAGVYSAYAEAAALNYLRGYQLTDATGSSEFLSIFPGAYPGRAVHVHFSVRTNPAGGGATFTSQLYFPEEVLAEVFAQAPYSANKPQTNTTDGIFNAGGPNLIPRMSKSGAGWLAEFDLGLA